MKRKKWKSSFSHSIDKLNYPRLKCKLTRDFHFLRDFIYIQDWSWIQSAFPIASRRSRHTRRIVWNWIESFTCVEEFPSTPSLHSFHSDQILHRQSKSQKHLTKRNVCWTLRNVFECFNPISSPFSCFLFSSPFQLLARRRLGNAVPFRRSNLSRHKKKEKKRNLNPKDPRNYSQKKIE